MTWKGAVVLVLLVLALGGAYWYQNPNFDLSVFGKIGLAESAKAEKAEQSGSGAPEPAADFERGPHNGRMLRSGGFAIEVTIFETGVPPEFHFYPYVKDKPVEPSKVTATVELARLDGDVDKMTFTPQTDHLKGSGTVIEPHSFDVTVTATYDGESHGWKYSSYEGRTSISKEAAEAAGMVIEKAAPAAIEESIVLNGSVVLNQNKTAQVKARFPGVVKKVTKNVGEPVTEGEIIAVIESNASLTNYEVRAPFAGVILQRNTNLGDVTGDNALFVVADLSTVWAEFHVFSKDIGVVKAGQKIRVKNIQGDDGETESTVTIFTPVAELSSQSVLARVTLDNSDGRWRPGMTVRGKVIVQIHDVPLAVKSSGLQRFRDFTVVFAKVADTYEVRMLDLGVNDDVWTEVKGGLKPGTEYVTDNSFIVKADVEKSGASHDH